MSAWSCYSYTVKYELKSEEFISKVKKQFAFNVNWPNWLYLRLSRFLREILIDSKRQAIEKNTNNKTKLDD